MAKVLEITILVSFSFAHCKSPLFRTARTRADMYLSAPWAHCDTERPDVVRPLDDDGRMQVCRRRRSETHTSLAGLLSLRFAAQCIPNLTLVSILYIPATQHDYLCGVLIDRPQSWCGVAQRAILPDTRFISYTKDTM